MKNYKLCAMGNGIVDILIEVSYDELNELGWEKGSWGMIQPADVAKITERFSDRENALASGGSAANSIIMFAQLGGKAAFFSSIGKDNLGKHFTSEFESFGVTMGSPVTSSQPTGSCVTLITPDAERTMRVCLAASNDFCVDHVNEYIIADSEWILLEGYLFSGGEIAVRAVDKALECAKKHNTKVAVTVSAVPIIENHRDVLDHVLENAELIFANENEAQAYARSSSLQESVDMLADSIPHVVVTAGPDGAFICCDGAEMQIPACKCTPVDLTGAGDAYAGAYLYGICYGYTPEEAGKRAAKMSKTIITHKGARYTGSVDELQALYKL